MDGEGQEGMNEERGRRPNQGREARPGDGDKDWWRLTGGFKCTGS